MGLFQPLRRRPWAEDRFGLVVSRGYVQLVRHSGRPPLHLGAVGPLSRPEGLGGDLEAGGPELEELGPDREDVSAESPPAGQGDRGQSSKSRNNMRRLFASLPWEMLGPRPAMVSVTYPGEWKDWVPDGRVMEGHRRAFERRWVRRWGEPLIGVWAKEFQASGRPHMHFYLGLPTAMSDADFEGLRQRTLIRRRLERSMGTYRGRGATPPIGGLLGGEFAEWLLSAWSEIVGTAEAGNHHRTRGADVAVMFWTDEVAATADRTQVAAYLAREASKWRQKRPPEGFTGVGHYYGHWGAKFGFDPIREEVPVDRAVAAELERRLARWVGWKLYVDSHGRSVTLRPKTSVFLRHWGDGITAFGLGPDQAARLLRWSEAAALRKAMRHPQTGTGPDGDTSPVRPDAYGSSGGWPAQPDEPPRLAG